ncbi:tyrosine-protein kinase CSK-like isoform X1, partial [Argonauta hians]
REWFISKDTYYISTCSSKKNFGPKLRMCNTAYDHTNLKSITMYPSMQGVQVWTVPRTGEYGLVAIGAQGGSAIYPISRAQRVKTSTPMVTAHFNLTEGAEIYILVGQKGQDACDVDDETKEFIPLVIAGGSGGIGRGVFHKDLQLVYFDKNYTINGINGNMTISGGGAGGGWRGETSTAKAGMSLLSGSIGGTGCPGPDGHHTIFGGFGGGGGACRGGGGGGGFKGGDGGSELGSNGLDGSSFVNQMSVYYRIDRHALEGDGEVDIFEYFDCDCEEICLAQENESQNYTCHCRDESMTGKSSCYVYRLLKKHSNAAMATKNAGVKCTPSNINHIVMQFNASYTALDFSNPDMEIKQIPREQLQCVSHIGRGAFGEVYQGVLFSNNREHSPLKVAIKTLPALYTDELELDFVMEAIIMSKFDHPNIVKFLGVCFDNTRPHYIVLELLEGGNLKDFLYESRPKPKKPSNLNVLQVVKIASDIAKGCQYLEEQHFIHRDIAARNCLLTMKGSNGVAKIADFGMARDVYRSNYYRKTSRGLLPVKWMPPEAYLDGIFSSKADVWAYGITLWEIFSLASEPYPGKSNQEVMQYVVDGGRLSSPENCPLSIFHLMTCTWDPNPDLRPPFSTIVQKLQYCYEDPNTATYTLPTFEYNYLKEHSVELPDIEKSSLAKADKKSSHSSFFSESLSDKSKHTSSFNQTEDDDKDFSCASVDSYNNIMRQVQQDIETETSNDHVPGMWSYINHLYMNQKLPFSDVEYTSGFDSNENSIEISRKDNKFQSQHYHNQHSHQLVKNQVPSTSHESYLDIHESSSSIKQNQTENYGRNEGNNCWGNCNSSSNPNNTFINQNENSHDQHKQSPLQKYIKQRQVMDNDFQNSNNMYIQPSQSRHSQKQQQQRQQKAIYLQPQQENCHNHEMSPLPSFQRPQTQDKIEQDDFNRLQAQRQLPEPDEIEHEDATLCMTPTKIPLLQSTDAGSRSYENDNLSKNPLCKILLKSSQNVNYIPLKNIQSNPSQFKYSNVETHSLSLSTMNADENDVSC